MRDESQDLVLMASGTGLVLDPWQQETLRADKQQIILNCTRQGGKSTVLSFLALHKAIYTEHSLVLLLSPSLRQSQELFRKVKDAHASLSYVVRAREESALRLEFDNGSCIVALPDKEATIRGFSGVALLIVDEASRGPDALYYSIRPMLAVSGGKIVLLSTPFGKRGFFFDVWESGGPEWKKIKITAHDCSRITREFIEQEKRSMPDMFFRSEYMCEFTETTDQVFSYDDIQRALDDSVKPLFGDKSI